MGLRALRAGNGWKRWLAFISLRAFLKTNRPRGAPRGLYFWVGWLRGVTPAGALLQPPTSARASAARAVDK